MDILIVESAEKLAYMENMSLDRTTGFLGVGGTAAGAGIASALVSLGMTAAVPLIVPIVGGLIGLGLMKFGGVLDNPEKPVFDTKQDVEP